MTSIRHFRRRGVLKGTAAFAALGAPLTAISRSSLVPSRAV